MWLHMTHHRLCLPGDKALHHLCLTLCRLQCTAAAIMLSISGMSAALTRDHTREMPTRKMDTAFGIMRRTVAAPCTSIRSTTSAFADSASST